MSFIRRTLSIGFALLLLVQLLPISPVHANEAIIDIKATMNSSAIAGLEQRQVQMLGIEATGEE
ncbi:hypothetical protein ACF3MZ_25915 [Paenibacillaceae bacterium WGS1546]|uniref:hypothetical protein n=1 Tax=Cohnella sp. WGS1546 TaxID=3366810 RepID=UPI00372D431F